MKKELIKILCRKSFKYNQEPIFKLVSGQMSRFYINCKLTTLSPRGMYLIGQIIFDTIKDLKADGIGGLTFGADPIAIATAFVSELKESPINSFSVRKNRKNHGIVKWIEGDIKPGQRVVIIDDVVTTGGSTIKAIERVRSEAVQVVKVVVLVDRQGGGLENIRKYVTDVTAIVTKDELIEQFEKDKQDV